MKEEIHILNTILEKELIAKKAIDNNIKYIRKCISDIYKNIDNKLQEEFNFEQEN